MSVEDPINPINTKRWDASHETAIVVFECGATVESGDVVFPPRECPECSTFCRPSGVIR